MHSVPETHSADPTSNGFRQSAVGTAQIFSPQNSLMQNTLTFQGFARSLLLPKLRHKDGVAEQVPDDFDFVERLGELNEELEILNSEAHQLEERIAENVVKILEDKV